MGGMAAQIPIKNTPDANEAEPGSHTRTHGEIPALSWPAMTLDFVIAALGLVKGIAPGAPVRFVFEAGEPGEYIVTGIGPLAGGAAAAAAGDRSGEGANGAHGAQGGH